MRKAFEVVSLDQRIAYQATRAVCRTLKRDLEAEGIRAVVRPITQQETTDADTPDYAHPLS